LAVFVLDKRQKPLMPWTEKRARQLLERRRAVVHNVYPFTIRLKDRVGGVFQPVRVKLDPGSKTTGIAVAREEGGKSTSKFFSVPTGMATPYRLPRFGTASRLHSFPA
jgi:hypothetical protein